MEQTITMTKEFGVMWVGNSFTSLHECHSYGEFVKTIRQHLKGNHFIALYHAGKLIAKGDCTGVFTTDGKLTRINF